MRRVIGWLVMRTPERLWLWPPVLVTTDFLLRFHRWFGQPTMSCRDCGEPIAEYERVGWLRVWRPVWPWEWYMVRDEVWAAARMTEGFLCVGCLEGRLERPLTQRDFADVPAGKPSMADSERLWEAKTRV